VAAQAMGSKVDKPTSTEVDAQVASGGMLRGLTPVENPMAPQQIKQVPSPLHSPPPVT